MSVNLQSALAAARGGDEPGREALLALTRPQALRWAGRLVSDEATAEDVAQEALLEIWANLEQLREPQAFLAWVHLVVRKHADRHRRGVRPLVGLGAVDVVDPADGPLDAVVREDEAGIVRRALALAPDQDRRLLELKYAAGMADRDLAELLGITHGAVRKRLHDARRRLRPVLDQTLDHHPQRRRTLVEQRFGRLCDVTDGPPVDTVAIVDLTPLATGIRVLDALLPVPRAGLVDLCGPRNTGSMVLLSELVARLKESVLVGACSSPDSLLPMLVEDPSAQPERFVVFHGEPAAALGSAASRAGELAREGRTVLLVVDRGLEDVLTRLPLALAHGSVTVIQVANCRRRGTRFVLDRCAHADPAQPTAGSSGRLPGDRPAGLQVLPGRRGTRGGGPGAAAAGAGAGCLGGSAFRHRRALDRCARGARDRPSSRR